MHKFFVEDYQIDDRQVIIDSEDYNHIVNVLRMKKDDKILVTNKKSQKTYNCEIKEINADKVICNIIVIVIGKTSIIVKVVDYE